LKVLTGLVSVLLLLNVYLIWCLGDSSKVSAAAPHDIVVTPESSNIIDLLDIKKDMGIDPIQGQLVRLNTRLDEMERRLEMLDIGDQLSLDASGENALIERVVGSIHSQINPLSSDEWFWSAGAGRQELSLSFSQTEGLEINSVVCRSDWCRVEIEDSSDSGGDLVSDLELHLRINESLGRDTVIRSGERNGRHRVMYIQ
jgi:hypothetical protein